MSVEGSAPAGNTAPSEAILNGQAPVEGQVEAQKPQQDDKFASKFAALSRKEREIREHNQKIQAERAEIEKERAEVEKWRSERSQSESQLQARLKQSPLKVLEEMGLTFEDLTKMQLNEQNPTAEMLIKQQREELETGYKSELQKLRDEMKAKEEQEEKKQYEQTVSGFKSQISDFVDANADTYELVKMNDAQDLVFDVIQEYYESTGRILTIEEAAKHTEEHLETEARKIFEAKKFKQSSQPKSEAPQTAPTLSNALSSEVPHQGDKKLTREESIARAAKMIRWQE